MKHIVYISDFNMGGQDSAEQAVARSGYSNIGMEICRRLAATGYNVKIMGLGYTGQEHWENFSIIPCNSLQDAVGYTNNLKFMWGGEGRELGNGVDAVVVALDINYFQEQIFPAIKQMGVPYICITPLESDPLCITWANLLMQMNKVFFISQFGADEAQKAGVNAEHIEIGIDTVSWRLRTQEEYEQIRLNMGFDKDDFVVMTVADNQERKNLGRAMQIVSELKRRGVSVKYVLVTRENSMVGWKLYDLAYELGISSELRVFKSGMPFADLYALYCGADAFLLPSKGEGLGLPVMEAMCIGIPVVANKTGALPELLADGRGWIVDWANWYYDPFGNQKRYDIDVEKAVDALLSIKNSPETVTQKTEEARKFMETKTWDKTAQQLIEAIEEVGGHGE